MRNLPIFPIFTLTVLIVIVSCAPVYSQGRMNNVIPGHYIVVLNDGISNPSEVAREIVEKQGLILGLNYKYAIKGFSAQIPSHKLRDVELDPRVRFIEPDVFVHAVKPPPGVGGGKDKDKPPPPQELPTGIDRIDADLSGTANIDGVDERIDVDIAIIDTGVSKSHPDLDFYQGVTIAGIGKPGGDDDNGHGSHCAGIAAAIDNDIGVVGVAPGARLWSAKVLNKKGSGTISSVIGGIDWVTLHADEIDVANMSLSGGGYSPSMHIAIQNSVAAGVFYAVAAGNNAHDVYGYDATFGTYDDRSPAAFPEVATISAMGDSDGMPGGLGGYTSWGADDTFVTAFSNFSQNVVEWNPVNSPGAAIDLAAPGADIKSTWKGDGYNTISGTSMSSPHAAGAAALYISVFGKPADAADVYAVRQALIDMGAPQDGAKGFSGDPDNNHEPLLDAEFL